MMGTVKVSIFRICILMSTTPTSSQMPTVRSKINTPRTARKDQARHNNYRLSIHRLGSPTSKFKAKKSLMGRKVTLRSSIQPRLSLGLWTYREAHSTKL